ncbi:MAG TPA: antibiotic biosynthesis monooxygenase family protein [Candidatus Eisenbacteria bacterium]|nr:antibiotic biosynthesis monooxygenase family protein [Candidatus Eisenbacteria bacterium]
MLVVVWEYRARPERAEEFESYYRPDGPWSRLFRESPGFISTTLMKDLRDPHRFMVADRWTSETVFEEFLRERAPRYQELSEAGRRLYESEVEVGRFDFLD